MHSARRSRALVTLAAAALSGCFLVTGLEDASTGGANPTGSTSSATSDTTSASNQSSSVSGSGDASSSASTGEGGAGGMAPVSYVRVADGLRFESVAVDDQRVFVAGTKEPSVLDLDGVQLSNQRALFVAGFSLTTGMADWVKEIRTYEDPPSSHAVSIAIGSDRLIVGSTTEDGMWLESIAFDGSGMPAPLATCANPAVLADFYRGIKVATIGTEIAVAFQTATRNTDVTINCTPNGPTSTIMVAGAMQESMLFTYDGTFSAVLPLSGLVAGADTRPEIGYMTLGGAPRIAFAFERGGAMPAVHVGVAQRGAGGVTSILTPPTQLASVLGGLGKVTFGGTDQFAVIAGSASQYAGVGPLGSGSGLLRAKLIADGTYAAMPQKLDHDNLNDAVTAGLLAGDSVRVVGARALVGGFANDAHKLTVLTPPEGVSVGENSQRSMFFVDLEAVSFDRVDHAVSFSLGPKTLGLEIVAEGSLVDDALVAAGVIPDGSTLCGQTCAAFPGSGERGCAFLMRQPLVPLVDAQGNPRPASGCYAP